MFPRFRTQRPAPLTPRDEAVSVRRATAADQWALWRLAHRDTRPVPRGEMWVAEVDGLIVAAVAASGEAIAEPFRSTDHLVRMLRAYASLPDVLAA